MGSPLPVGTAGYKLDSIARWNEVAPRYHSRWAGPGTGPFGCTDDMLEMVGVSSGAAVLDLACGTGAASRRLAQYVGPSGRVVGVDTSWVALRVAKQCGVPPNLAYVNADAEAVSFAASFDAVVCQFGLFFFPDAGAALRNALAMTVSGGRLGIVVHGSREEVPYYGCIMQEVLSYIPDYLPGGPALDRYSDGRALRKEAEGAGYGNVVVRALTYRYSPGDFDSYWNGYVGYIPGAQRRRLLSLDADVLAELREAVRRRTKPYTGPDGTIQFPWQVLILTASA